MPPQTNNDEAYNPELLHHIVSAGFSWVSVLGCDMSSDVKTRFKLRRVTVWMQFKVYSLYYAGLRLSINMQQLKFTIKSTVQGLKTNR